MSVLQGKTIVLGVCGGIAAYKAAALTSKLTQAGAIVRVIMTKSAVAIRSAVNVSNAVSSSCFCGYL